MVGVSNYYSRIYGCYIKNIPITTYARIDFINTSGCVYPTGSIINIPGQAVDNIYIRNDGAATIQYSVNGANIDDMIGGVLASTYNRDISFKNTNVKSVNVYCLSTGNALFANVSIEVKV